MELGTLKGVGPARQKALGEAGVIAVEDLLSVLPRTYQDWSDIKPVSALAPGQETLVRLRVVTQPSVSYPRRGLSIVRAWGEDATGRCALQWFNQPYVKQALVRGGEYLFYGRVGSWRGTVLVNPACRKADGALPGLVPVYPLLGSVSPTLLRDLVKQALAACPEPQETLPPGWPERLGLMGLAAAVKNVHFPGDRDALRTARERMAFEQVLLFQLAVEMLRQRRAGRRGRPLAFDGDRITAKCDTLPYALTGAQRRVLGEALNDMREPAAMARLVQGDVGSGKTVVALLCAYAAALARRQTAFMAPTEILARQHYRNARAFFDGTGVSVALLTGGMPEAEKKAAAGRIARGEADVVVGTHALIQEGVSFRALGLAVTDEQHRFGVMQRAALEEKGETCDVLVMSATPIPRTLALIMYADMDVSVIDELPPGRLKTTTRLVPQGRRADMYAFVAKQAKEGGRAYVICPLVEESEEVEAQSAAQVYEELKEGPLRDVNVGLLHGRMRSPEKAAAMEAFSEGRVQVLVSTTVVEVGMDVPEATVMVVENAERFGLAQLHQLRGRVGRGEKPSYCFLLPGNDAPETLQRMDVLVQNDDGFEVARRDLALRGPGEFLGTRQHGSLPWPGASLCDMRMLKNARDAARAILALDANDSLYRRMTDRCHRKYEAFLERDISHT